MVLIIFDNVRKNIFVVLWFLPVWKQNKIHEPVETKNFLLKSLWIENDGWVVSALFKIFWMKVVFFKRFTAFCDFYSLMTKL